MFPTSPDHQRVQDDPAGGRHWRPRDQDRARWWGHWHHLAWKGPELSRRSGGRLFVPHQVPQRVKEQRLQEHTRTHFIAMWIWPAFVFWLCICKCYFGNLYMVSGPINFPWHNIISMPPGSILPMPKGILNILRTYFDKYICISSLNIILIDPCYPGMASSEGVMRRGMEGD